MTDLEVCPFCDTAAHKVLRLNGIYYCKECNRFFSLELKQPRCPKCNSKKIKHSDFPMPSGEPVFHCESCKKTYAARSFFENSSI